MLNSDAPPRCDSDGVYESRLFGEEMNPVHCPACDRLLYSHTLTACPFCEAKISPDFLSYETSIINVPLIGSKPDRGEPGWMHNTRDYYFNRLCNDTQSSLRSERTDEGIQVILDSANSTSEVMIDSYQCVSFFRMALARLGLLIGFPYGGSGTVFARIKKTDYKIDVSLSNSAENGFWFAIDSHQHRTSRR